MLVVIATAFYEGLTEQTIAWIDAVILLASTLLLAALQALWKSRSANQFENLYRKASKSPIPAKIY